MEEIKISPGVLLIIFACIDDKNMCMPLQLRCIDTGRTVATFNYNLEPHDGRIEFIEQFKEKLIVKQYNGPLKIFDVSKKVSDPVIVSALDFVTPRAFIYLYFNEIFLTFTGCQVSVCVLLWIFSLSYEYFLSTFTYDDSTHIHTLVITLTTTSLYIYIRNHHQSNHHI